MATSGEGRRNRSRLAGMVIAVGGLLTVLMGFVNWALITNPGAADGTLTGWGGIGGVEDMAGQNINDVIAELGGSGSYRPALFTTVLGAIALIVGLLLVWRRIALPAGIAVGCGLGIAAFALFRAFVPGDVSGIVEDGGTRSGIGPWLTALYGLVIVAAGIVALLDRPVQPVALTTSRGIQPR